MIGNLTFIVVLLALLTPIDAKTYTVDLDNTTATIFERLVALGTDSKATNEEAIQSLIVSFVGQNYERFFLDQMPSTGTWAR